MRRLIFVVTFHLVLSGCFGEPTIDASTPDSLAASLVTVKENLSAQDRDRFEKAFTGIVAQEFLGDNLFAAAAKASMMNTPDAMLAQLKPVLHGKMASEIVAIFESRKAERERERTAEAKRKTEAEVELTALKNCLSENVRVLEAAIVKGEYVGENIVVKIENRLNWAIAGVRVDYSAKSPGRPVPWLKDNFFISVSGGINPGEIRTIRTNVFNLPDDVALDSLVVEASVSDVQDADERQLVREVRLFGAPDERSPNTCGAIG